MVVTVTRPMARLLTGGVAQVGRRVGELVVADTGGDHDCDEDRRVDDADHPSEPRLGDDFGAHYSRKETLVPMWCGGWDG